VLQFEVMSWYHPSSVFDKVFEAGLLIKGASALAEFLSGLLLFFVTPASIHRFLTFITQQRLSEDPHDKFAHFVLHSADSLNVSNKGFLVAYLWVLSAVKLISVVGILKNVLWVYPFALITLGLLTLIEIYEIFTRSSIGLAVLTIFDIFILCMIWREYTKAKISLASPHSSSAKD
jgi:uncharacterized membrane protein